MVSKHNLCFFCYYDKGTMPWVKTYWGMIWKTIRYNLTGCITSYILRICRANIMDKTLAILAMKKDIWISYSFSIRLWSIQLRSDQPFYYFMIYCSPRKIQIVKASLEPRRTGCLWLRLEESFFMKICTFWFRFVSHWLLAEIAVICFVFHFRRCWKEE